MKTRLFFLPILILLMASSCHKDKYNKPIGNRREMLTGSTWRVNEIIEDGASATPTCKLDDLWVFSSDGGNGYLDDGADRCSEEDNTTFTYSVTGDQRFVYLYNMSNPTTYGTHLTDSYRLSFEFLYMTEREMIVKYYDQEGEDGMNHHYKIRFLRVD